MRIKTETNKRVPTLAWLMSTSVSGATSGVTPSSAAATRRPGREFTADVQAKRSVQAKVERERVTSGLLYSLSRLEGFEQSGGVDGLSVEAATPPLYRCGFPHSSQPARIVGCSPLTRLRADV